MPETVDIPPLEEIDDEQMRRLTKQESYSIQGQILKMQMVQAMLDERMLFHEQRVRKDLREQGLRDEQLEGAVERCIQPFKSHTLPLGDGRFVLIVEKGEDEYEADNSHGEGQRIRPAYSVMVPAHIDTVKGDKLELKQDGDRWEGLGTYDMGNGVLNNIALAAECFVPKGMKAYFVFTPDEEETSRGARLLIKQWDRWPEIDAVVSSEIGPVPPLPPSEKKMQVIIGRTGRDKYAATLSISPRKRGHAAKRGLPNATDAMAGYLVALRERFYHGFAAPVKADDEPPLQQEHPVLGLEEIESGVIRSYKNEGYVHPHRAELDFAIKTVPPTTLPSMKAWMERIARGVAKRGKWRDFGIDMTLVRKPDEASASYSPFCMPEDSPVVGVTLDILRQITGVAPEIVRVKPTQVAGGTAVEDEAAASVADECDYAEDMLKRLPGNTFAGSDVGVVSIPPNGKDAHHPDESVSRQSTAYVREAIKRLIEDPVGFPRLAEKRKKKAA